MSYDTTLLTAMVFQEIKDSLGSNPAPNKAAFIASYSERGTPNNPYFKAAVPFWNANENGKYKLAYDIQSLEEARLNILKFYKAVNVIKDFKEQTANGKPTGYSVVIDDGLFEEYFFVTEFKAKEKLSDVGSKYELTYSSQRELRLNGILLAKPQYKSENDLFLQFFVGQNHTGEHGVDELLEFMGKAKLTKRPTQILGDVRITKEIKAVFFPVASVADIEFRNPITHEYAKQHNLPVIELEKLKPLVRSSQN
jgi:hypothetical protein